MEEVTLRNGEIAFLASGTVIMNVDTAIELKNKLEKQEAEKEQSPEEAMENAMLLLTLLFGPEILDKKPVVQKPVAPVKPVRDPKDNLHPQKEEKFYFPGVLVGDTGSARRHYNDSVYVYVDNYGNVFGTMGECDWRHNMASGATQKIITGKQQLGYGHYTSTCVPSAMLVNVGPYDKKIVFHHKHIVSVVRVPKSAILPNSTNTRESRYRAWKNAMVEANKLIDNILMDEDAYKKVINTQVGHNFAFIFDEREAQMKKYQKEFGKDYLEHIPDVW